MLNYTPPMKTDEANETSKRWIPLTCLLYGVCCSFPPLDLLFIVQEYLLANLLIDLALLDQYMFRFRPGTLATAALFFARVTASYYSKVYYTGVIHF